MPRLSTAGTVVALTLIAASGVVVAALDVRFSAAVADGALVGDLLGFASLAVGAFLGTALTRTVAGHRAGLAVLAVLVVGSVGYAIGVVGTVMMSVGVAPPGVGAALSLLGLGSFPFLYLWPAILLLMFPAGRARSRLAVAATVLLIVGAVGVAAVFAGSPNAEPPYDDRANPLSIGLLAAVASGGIGPWWSALLAGLVLVIVDAARRARRAGADERIQLRWLAAGALTLPMTLAVCGALQAAVGGDGPWVPVGLLGASLATAAAIGIAVSRHGLFEVAQLRDSPRVAAVVLAAGAAVVIGGIAAAAAALGPIGPFLAAAVTAIVTPLLARARQRLYARIAPRLLAARRSIEALGRRTVTGDASPAEIERELRRVLDDEDLEVEYRLDDRWVTARGGPAEPGPGRRTILSRLDGEVIARLHHRSELAPYRSLLREVARVAAPLLGLARLELLSARRLAAELEARDAAHRAASVERDRIERDLHDGAQQRLVALGISLRRVEHALVEDAPHAAAAVGAAAAEVGAAVRDLRGLVSGTLPADLDGGLDAALRRLADRVPGHVAVDAAVGHVGTDVARAAYFIASEAVTNSIKHAGASEIRLSARAEAGSLVVEVADDGSRGATAPGVGRGLESMRRRADELGGTVSVDVQRRRGTRVVARLPLESP